MQTKKKLNFYNGRMKRISRLILSSLIFGSVITSPAIAAEQAILEEIIVTATKREQNVRDVTSVVNVVGGGDIDKLAVFNFDDIERVTSGLQLTQVNPRNATIASKGHKVLFRVPPLQGVRYLSTPKSLICKRLKVMCAVPYLEVLMAAISRRRLMYH